MVLSGANEANGEDNSSLGDSHPLRRFTPPPESDDYTAADDVRRDKILSGLGLTPRSRERRFGRYVVLDTLGRGGAGIVLKAYDEQLDRAVAIKLLRPDVDAATTGWLEREARALARLSHPNVVQVHEVGRAEGQSFIAMELVKGQTLAKWAHADPRPRWRACLRAYVQAGAGLAAAHAKGLVHRDFKPSNAIIDDEGHVRVLDFGLAQHADPAAVRARDTEPDIDDTARLELHASDGEVVGTPGYMPPEQMHGRSADARSDQFSFCLSLWEALYAERPFEGTTIRSLLDSMESSGVRRPPKGTTVPTSLRPILLRGLASDPQARWPSMKVLLQRLERQLGSRRRGWVLTASLLGPGIAIASLALAYQADMGKRCTQASSELAGVWDDTRRDEVERAFMSTELAYAADTWARVGAKLDDQADAWVDMHTEACEATAVWGQQSEEILELRMGCLDDRRKALDATVSVLAQADALVVRNAVQMVGKGPRLDMCSDVDRLRDQQQRVPPPEDRETAAVVEQIRGQLEVVRALQGAGQYREGIDTLQPLLERARAVGYMPVVAEAQQRRGRLRLYLGDYDPAAQDLTEAYSTAAQLDHERVEMRAAVGLTYLVGFLLADHERGLQWGRIARPLAERVGDTGDLTAAIGGLASVLQHQGQYERAEAEFRRAIDIQEQSSDADHPNVLAARTNLANVLFLQGRYREAEQLTRSALEARVRIQGPGHPAVADVMQNLGTILISQERLEQAEPLLRRAQQILERAVGPHHPDVGNAIGGLGNLFYRQGRYAEAEHQLRAMLELKERALGPDHPEVAACLNNLGAILDASGHLEEAERVHERALRIREARLGPDHTEVAYSLNNLGTILQRRRRYPEAEQYIRRALEITERALGPDHSDTANAVANLANVRGRQDDYAGSEALHRRAMEIREQALTPQHPEVGRSAIGIGSMLLKQRRYDEARAAYTRALEILEKALGATHHDVARPLVGLASTNLAQRRSALAVPQAERALSIVEAAAMPAESQAEARFVLARALWDDRSQRIRARRLAELTRDAFAELSPRFDTERSDVDAWLARHRVR
ncbi:MAG: serine/threonine-protein kinase [Deltaproteobacteria bacterium]|nr:serine/threonine-protein kinase [Deltaproteobacteria bacterium]